MKNVVSATLNKPINFQNQSVKTLSVAETSSAGALRLLKSKYGSIDSVKFTVVERSRNDICKSFHHDVDQPMSNDFHLIIPRDS